jgi:hypothetical protein
MGSGRQSLLRFAFTVMMLFKQLVYDGDGRFCDRSAAEGYLAFLQCVLPKAQFEVVLELPEE